MKDMKFKVNSGQHSKEIQECLFKLGFIWRCGGKTVQFTESPYLFAYCGTKAIKKHDDPDIAYFTNHENIETTLEELKEKLNQTKKQPHVHAELIRAWADGAVIQYADTPNTWVDCPRNQPNWDSDVRYRIKPEQTDVAKYGVEVGDVWYIPYFKELHTIRSVNTDAAYTGGKVIKTLNGTEISYGMSIEDKCKLVFRRGVINEL